MHFHRNLTEKDFDHCDYVIAMNKSEHKKYLDKHFAEFADKIENDDKVFEDNGIKLIINPKSYVYLKGTQLDFSKEGINEGFKFKNPNVKDTCGCGESFNV